MGISGCATGPGAVVISTCNAAQLIIPPAIDVAMAEIVKNPAQEQAIENEMYQVSINVHALVTSGNVTSAGIETAFNIKSNAIINGAFQGIAKFVESRITGLTNSSTAALEAEQILACVSADVAAATKPAAIAQAKAKTLKRLTLVNKRLI